MWLRMLVSQAVKQAAQDQVRKLLNEPAGGGLPGDEPRPLDPESLRADALIVFGSAAEAAGWVDLQAEVETWPTEQGTLHKSQMGAVSCLAWINRNSPPTFLEDLIAWARPRLVVLAGFAVGLDPDARRGSLVIGQQVAKSGSDELTSPLGFDDSSGAGQGLVMGKLITVNAPPEPGEPRQRLATEHSALAADPDAYAYAEIAERKGRPWIAIRVVSEAWDHTPSVQLKSLLDQASLTGKIGVAVGSLMQEPKSASELWRIQEDAIKLSDRLAKFLKSFLQGLA